MNNFKAHLGGMLREKYSLKQHSLLITRVIFRYENSQVTSHYFLSAALSQTIKSKAGSVRFGHIFSSTAGESWIRDDCTKTQKHINAAI